MCRRCQPHDKITPTTAYHNNPHVPTRRSSVSTQTCGAENIENGGSKFFNIDRMRVPEKFTRTMVRAPVLNRADVKIIEKIEVYVCAKVIALSHESTSMSLSARI